MNYAQLSAHDYRMLKLKYILTLSLLIFSLTSKGQKIYVWCPENFQIKPRIGLMENDTINIVFFDGRSIPKKTKIECNSDQIIQGLVNQIRTAYPSVIFKELPEKEYYTKGTQTKHIIIKIGLAAYHAGFGTDISGGIGMVGGQFSTMVFPRGQWNGITAYYVQFIKNGETTTKEISNISSKPNMWGYKSARNALNDTYNKSNQELLFFIDHEFMK